MPHPDLPDPLSGHPAAISGHGPQLDVQSTSRRAQDSGESDQIRLRLALSYDGTHFSGWATQPTLRTVAGELTTALETLLRSPVSLVVAGRTDAGVHATGQVAHIDINREALVALAPRRKGVECKPDAGIDVISGVQPSLDQELDQEFAEPLRGLIRRLAGILPADIRVRQAHRAAPGFDARFSALRRHYRYRVTDAPSGVEPLRRFDTLAWPRPLDVGRMNEAAGSFIGLHDFAAYCKPREGATTVREVQQLTVTRIDEPGEVIAIDVSADAFCHSMVRSLVGSLLAVGEGRVPTDDPGVKLGARQRTSAIHVAPARGLTLVGVDYPSSSELSARAKLTRAHRSLP